MEDIVFVTADSVRDDYADHMPFVSSFGVHTGITLSHYTRSSLAGIHAGQYRAVVDTEVTPPTLATELSDNGYTCLGYSPNPNTDARFGFDSGFDIYESFVKPGRQGSRIRQYLSKFRILRRLYYKIYPPQAKSADRPSDREVIDTAVEQFNDSVKPRFLWVHLMESHRPYGSGDDAVSRRLDQKAFFSPEKLTEREKGRIQETYIGALQRVDDNVEYLLSRLDSDPVFLFTADHGEGFGDSGFYFHQSHRRRVDDYLIEVPAVFDGFNVHAETFSHIDLAPTILDRVGIAVPGRFKGSSLLSERTPYAITIAPWHDKATLAWSDFEDKLIARDAHVSFEGERGTSVVERSDVSVSLEEQLRNLGYLDAG